jgi:hypothetical protein
MEKLEEFRQSIPTINGSTKTRWKDVDVTKWPVREAIKQGVQRDM